MSKRLRFKGDAPKKSKKRKSGSHSADSSTYEPLEVDSLDDLNGPILILSQTTEPPSVLFCSEKLAVSFKVLGDAATTIKTAEPDNVGQVFQATKLPTGEARVSLKSAYDRYLTTDKIGIVTCSPEAVGPSEEWEVVKREDGFAMSAAMSGKFLSADDGSSAVRADSDAIGFREVFHLRCQAEFKHKAKKGKSASKEVDAAALDFEQLKKFQSYGRAALSPEDLLAIKRAQKRGNVNEVLIERREKIKADKFCK
ncbi:FRG1-like family-domain-containing protein [Zopfochytrium polystomum]|nr:FRG1-like family-domain-containing protein [Zopfochytrium polystomum]